MKASNASGRHVATIVAAALCMAGVPGCNDARRVEALEKSLGDFRYFGQTPSVVIRVLHHEVVEPKDKYSRAEVRVTGVVEQTGDFPLSKYRVSARLLAHRDSEEIAGGSLDCLIDAGNGAFSTSLYCSELPAGKAPKLSELTFVLDEYNWWPEMKRPAGAATLTVAKQ